MSLTESSRYDLLYVRTQGREGRPIGCGGTAHSQPLDGSSAVAEPPGVA